MKRWLLLTVLTAVTVGGLQGCKTTELGGAAGRSTKEAKRSRLATIETLYDQGRLTEAMLRCIDLSQQDADYPGLAEMQVRITSAMTERQGRLNMLYDDPTTQRMAADIDSQMRVPETYGLMRHVNGENAPLRTDASRMQKALDAIVSVHLEEVSIADFILTVGEAENINMIADSAIDETQTMTIHVDRAPLSEILEYVARNLDVSFFIGQNVIWVTPRDLSQPTTPMETRVYHLRKGLSGDEMQAGDDINIMNAIGRFVPATPGSDMMFDRKAHVLLCRNTRENLRRVEDIIEALDVSPPQVLIEARIISTSLSDLRELGIDWILDSAMGVTSKAVMENGQMVSATRTQVDAGAAVTATPPPNEAIGMNFTYRGLLTDPMFRAVVHALETSGKARTLSVPKVTTVNNKEARMRIGEDFRYFDEYDVQQVADRSTGLGNTTYNSVLVPVGSPKLEELGIELIVAPSVGADLRTIDLTITPDISEFIRWEYYQTSGSANSSQSNNDNNNSSTNASFDLAVVKLPIFRRSTIETEVIVQSGETVVMGGLITSQETKTQNGVPFLSSIPFLGRLFQSEQIDDQKRNLLVFVTATIISDRGESLIPVPVGYRPESEESVTPIQRAPDAGAAPKATTTWTPQRSVVRGSVRLGNGSDADSRFILTLPDGRVITAADLSAGFVGYKGLAKDVSFLAADGGVPQSLNADGVKFALLDDVLYRVSANRMVVELFNADPSGNANWVISMTGAEARIDQLAAQ